MKLACVTFTEGAQQLAQEVCGQLTDWDIDIQEAFGPEKINLRAWVKDCFRSMDAILFVGACGIAVRMIAPYVQTKTLDPAVVVMDEKGKWVIPILSGHIGGANRLAEKIASISGGEAVITTATDVCGVWAVDEWATRKGLIIRNPHQIKQVSARLLKGEPITLFSDVDLDGPFPKQVSVTKTRSEADVIISPFDAPDDKQSALYLVPPCVNMGIGCRKGVTQEAVEKAYETAREKASLAQESIRGVFSIDLKGNEEGIHAFCAQRGFDFTTYDASVLEEVSGSVSSSDFVASITGVDSVCERSALVGADRLLLEKQVLDKVTIAFALKEARYDFEDDK